MGKAIGWGFACAVGPLVLSLLVLMIAAAATSSWGASRVEPVLSGVVVAEFVLFIAAEVVFYRMIGGAFESSAGRIGATVAHAGLNAFLFFFLAFTSALAFNR